MSKAIDDVLAERTRQVEIEGWTAEHDDKHEFEELAFAASCYSTAEGGDIPPAVWPWSLKWWKPRSRRSNLVRAAALIIAEIERLDRKHATRPTGPSEPPRPEFHHPKA